MRISTRLVVSFCTLLLLAFAISRHHTATAKIVLEEPTGEVGSILYHGASGFYHVVRYGETLSQIAQYYGVPAWHIMEHNRQIRSPHLIYAGYSIWIPTYVGGTGGGYAGICNRYHPVRYGDSLFGIAYYYGVNLHAIVAANGIVDPDYIYAGTSLYIPCP